MGSRKSFSHVLGVMFLLSINFFLSVHSASIPLPAGYTVVNNDALNSRVKNGDITRYIITDDNTNFALGFFNTGPANSAVAPGSLYYLAIVTKPTGDPSLWNLVWAANRGKPVHENATLSLANTGNLVLKDADGTFIWSTGSSTLATTSLSLDTSGNLKLLNGNNAVVWQSFDTPTDCLVPGQFLKTGNSLVSAKTLYNPATGLDYSVGTYSASALVGGLALFNGQTAYYIQSAETQLHTLNSVQKTCRHPNDLFFDSTQGLVIFTDGTKDAPPNQVDPSLCGHGDSANTTVVIPVTASTAGTATLRFARINPDGSLTLYQYDINSRAFVKVGSVGK